jgi:hypothetical protein
MDEALESLNQNRDQAYFMKLFSTRTTNTFGAVEAALLGLYTAVASWLAYTHAAWADEAQAWLIARDCTLGQILFERMHYEGTPGLWHALLWTLTRLGCPYGAMHVLSVAAGAAAAYLVLRYAPFPAPVRWLLPFSFAPLFQTAVVARSYSLVPVLVFGLCMAMLALRPRPVLVAVLAGLLANTSLIAFCLTMGLVGYYVFHLRGLGPTRPEKKQLWTAGTVLAVLGLFAIYTAIPAPDQSTGEAHGVMSNRTVGHAIARLTGIPMPETIAPKVQPHPTAFPVTSAAHGKISERLARWMQPATGRASHAAKLALSVVTWLSLLFYPVSSSNLLALAFYTALIAWLAALGRWRALLPLVVVLLGSKFLPFNEHHSIVVWAALIAVIWLSAEGQEAVANQHRRRRQTIFGVLLLAITIEQTAWTAAAAFAKAPFDDSLQTERFLSEQTRGRRVASFDYHTVTVLPFTAQPAFFNQRTTYWTWMLRDNTMQSQVEAVATRPDFILVGHGYLGDALWRNQILPVKTTWIRDQPDLISPYLDAHGYRETQRFCGNQPAHFGVSETDCTVVFEPVR